MEVSREDALGAGIARTGVYELAVSEVLWRLSARDELALDVGANIGYFTGLLCRRAVEVLAFEPNPRLRPMLTANVGRWQDGWRVRLDWRAASSSAGKTKLCLPRDFETNHGVATLESTDGELIDVETVRLEDVIEGRSVGVMKIDVEGHELAVLEGASALLRAGLIRDVVFEEHLPPPTPATEVLRDAGFTIWGIQESLRGPLLVDGVPTGWDAPTYLATRDPARAERLLGPRGWRCLRAHLA